MPVIKETEPNAEAVYTKLIRTVSESTNTVEAQLGYEAFLDAMEERSMERWGEAATGRKLAIAILIDRMDAAELSQAINLINDRLTLLSESQP